MATEDQAAEAAFASGYGGEPTGTPAPAPEPAKAEPKAEPAKVEEPKVDADPVAARFDKMQAMHDKLAGHIGRFERSLREINTTLATAQAAAKTVGDAPTQTAIKTAAEDPAEWATLKQQYPEWAAATEAMVTSRASSFDSEAFEAKVNAAIEGKTAAMQERIVDASLNAVYPGWRKEVVSPAFAAWVGAQPDDIKALTQSDDVGDAAKMLKLYEASKAAPAATPPQTKSEPSPREKRLAAAVNPRGAGGHAEGASAIDEFESGYTGR
jgi:hypothetical protein